MSSAADPTAPFLAALRASALLTPAQLDEIAAWAEQARPDVPALAKEVNRRGWLTAYQIREIARGRGKELLLDRYVLLDLLGEGGMGRVFKARDTRLVRDVALKVIRREKLANPAAAARFQTEVEAVGRMRHPNVVTAFDAHIGEVNYCVMELIDGSDLTKLIRERGPLLPAVACEYVRQAALGLHHAFEQGLVHRDVKPSNLLVTRDGRTVKVVDLGLARLGVPADGETRVTQDGFVLGTPDFLAPEQARNPSVVDTRADVYALGATLFYLLTGRVPFEGANATEKMVKHCTDPPPALLPLRPDVPPPVEQIIHWCMAKRPEDRPQTPLQLALALQPFCPRTAGVPMPGSGGYPALLPEAFPPPPAPAPPAVDPAPSDRVFNLPAPGTAPARRRAKAGFPTGAVLGVATALAVLGILGYAVLHFTRGGGPPPAVEPFTNSVGMKLVKIEGGTFKMGSPPDEPGRAEPRPGQPDDEAPVHEVTVRGPFLMAATEVTHGQYTQVVGLSLPQPPAVRRVPHAAELPAESVTYDEAVEFCRRLTEKEKGQPHARPGWAYRLPTEAEWEYAARAGTAGPFWTGATLLSRRQALFDPAADGTEAALDGGGTPGLGAEGIPGKPGQYDPNLWGLYDMNGNVAEWCHDWYQRGYPAVAQDNPVGPGGGTRRVVRGGSFSDPASACRSAARAFAAPADRRPTVGFRVVYAPALR